MNGPWAISCTCKLWRALALEYPILWTDIGIRFSLWNRKSTLQAMEKLEEGLKRARSSSLRITLVQEEEDIQSEYFDSSHEMESFLIVLRVMSNASRFLSLDALFSVSADMHWLLSLSNEPFTSLKHLDIDLLHRSDSEDGIWE